MIKHLHIENFAIISDVDIDFNSGLNVILGETGAGKSILLEALFLLRGTKAEFEKIRYKEEKALIEGIFIIEDEERLKRLKENSDFNFAGNEFILSRTLLKSGKSIQKINGKVVSLSSLKEFMKDEIDVYSQEDRPFYFDEALHIHLLDTFMPISKDDQVVYDAYEENYLKLLDIRKKIIEAQKLLDLKKDEEYLRYQYEEIDSADIKENEMEELEEKLHSLSSIVDLSDKFKRFEESSNNAIDELYEAKKVLESIHNDNIEEDKDNFINAYYELSSFKDNIMNYFEDLLSNINEIDYMKERLRILHNLKRKYGSTSKEIIDKKEELG